MGLVMQMVHMLYMVVVVVLVLVWGRVFPVRRFRQSRLRNALAGT
jgi:hypothetical protein